MAGPSRENARWTLVGLGTGLVLGAYLVSPRGVALGDAWFGPILLAWEAQLITLGLMFARSV